MEAVLCRQHHRQRRRKAQNGGEGAADVRMRLASPVVPAMAVALRLVSPIVSSRSGS